MATPKLPKHNSPALDKIEAAMKLAKERQAAMKPATPTVVIPPSTDPVQAQLDKARAAAAKQEAKDAKKAATQAKRDAYKAGVAARKEERATKKAAKLAEIAAKKALLGDRKSPEGKVASRIARALGKLSPEAFAAYEIAKDLNPEDAKALIRALYVLNTPVPATVTVVEPTEVKASEGDEDEDSETEDSDEDPEHVAAE